MPSINNDADENGPVVLIVYFPIWLGSHFFKTKLWNFPSSIRVTFLSSFSIFSPFLYQATGISVLFNSQSNLADWFSLIPKSFGCFKNSNGPSKLYFKLN